MKFVKHSLHLIESIEKGGSYLADNKIKADLVKTGKRGYDCTFSVDNAIACAEVGSLVSFTLESINLSLSVTNAYIHSHSVSAGLESIKTGHTIRIHEFQSTLIKKNIPYICQMIIPLRYKHSLDHIIRFSHTAPNDLDGAAGRLWRIHFSSKRQFDIYIVKKNSRNWLCIDSVFVEQTEKFGEYAWSILVTLGYMIGYLPQDDVYEFYRKEGKNAITAFRYRRSRKSLRHLYLPLLENPYGWNIPTRKTDAYYDLLKSMSIDQLSVFCRLTHRDVEIKSILLLITESLTGSLLIIPAGLSVALEGMSEWICRKHPEKTKPISDSKKSKEFIRSLINILDQQADDSFDKTIVRAKIENINAPTNRDKLSKPFAILGVNINDFDKEIIEYRNAFLHGDISLVGRDKRKYKISVYEVSLRLLTLINCLVLRAAGYEGYIINQAKIQGKVRKEDGFDYYIDLQKPFTR